MKENTPLQTLIEKIDLQLKNKFCPVDSSGLKMAKQLAIELLPKEREVIEKAFDEGQEQEYEYHVNSIKRVWENDVDYFNQTFNTPTE